MNKKEFIYSIFGLLLIDLGAMLYTHLYDDNLLVAFLFLFFGNCIGGVLHRWRSND